MTTEQTNKNKTKQNVYDVYVTTCTCVSVRAPERPCVCTCVNEPLCLYDHLGIIIDYDSSRNDGLMVIDRTLEHPLQCWHRSAINEILLTLRHHNNYGSRPSAIEITELGWKSRCNHH